MEVEEMLEEFFGEEYSGMTGYTQDVAKRVVRYMMGEIPPKGRITPKAVLQAEDEAVERLWRFTRDGIFIKNRTKELSDYRGIYIYTLWKITGVGFSTMYRLLDRVRDRSTLIHSCRTIEDRIPYEPDLKAKYVQFNNTVLCILKETK